MPISVECPDCGKVYKVSDSLAGKTGKCKACGAGLQVPAAATSAPPDLFADLEPLVPSRRATTSPPLDEDDDFQPPRAPVPGSMKTKKKRPATSNTGEIDPVYKWGFGIIMFGLAGIILPCFGIQFKGIHALPPEAQIGLMGIALLIGTGLLAGGKPANIYQRVFKYIWLTIMAVAVLLFGIGMVLVASGRIPEDPQPQPQQVVPPQLRPQMQIPQKFQPPPIPTPPQIPPGPQPQSLPAPGFQPAAGIPRPKMVRPSLAQRKLGRGPAVEQTGQQLFKLTAAEAFRKPDAKKNDIEVRFTFEKTSDTPPNGLVFAVVEGQSSKGNLPIHHGAMEAGKFQWTLGVPDDETGPFRFFIATVAFGPGGKSWVKVSNVVEHVDIAGK